MGWFKRLTGFSTPKIFKDIDDSFITPAFNAAVASSGAAVQAAVAVGKSVVSATTGGASAEETKVNSDRINVNQNTAAQRLLEAQIKKEFEKQQAAITNKFNGVGINDAKATVKDNSNAGNIALLIFFGIVAGLMLDG